MDAVTSRGSTNTNGAGGSVGSSKPTVAQTQRITMLEKLFSDTLMEFSAELHGGAGSFGRANAGGGSSKARWERELSNFKHDQETIRHELRRLGIFDERA